MLTPSLLPLLTFGLLPSLVRSHQDPRSVASAKATAVSATVIEFEWGKIVYPSDGLKAFLLRGVNGSGEASVEIDPKERKGRLTNLKPFTNYSTSVISLYSDSNATRNAGVVLTWSAAPSSPNLTSAFASGSQTIALSWTAPEISNGILEGYSAECYRPGDSYPEGSQRVSANTLSVEITGLRANTLFECAVIASTKEIRWGQGGGKSASARSSLLRTWPGITEQPIIKNATAVGPDSVFLEWWKVNNVYGILGHYRVNCSQEGQKDNVKSVQVSNDTLSAKLSGLIPNTRYRCTVEVFVLPNEQNLGGGYSQPSFERSPKTWPDVPTEPTEIAVTAVSSTAVKIDWKAPLTPNGDISKYRVVVYEGSQNLSYETGPGALSYVLDGLQPYTTTALAVQAYTNPNSDGLGGGFGKISPVVSVTTKEAAPGPVQLLSCIHTPPGSPRLACSWSSPLVHNGIIRKYVVQLMDMTSHRVVSEKMIEDTYVTFKEAFDFTHVYQVSVAAVTVLEGEKTNVLVQLRTSNSNKSLAGQGATEETIVGAKATDSNYIIDEEDPAGSHGNITETNLSGSHDNISGTSTEVPIELNEEETTREETSSSVAIAIAVTGIIFILALSTALYMFDVRSAMSHIPFSFGLNGRKVQSDYNINGPLEVKSNRSDSNRMYTKLEYLGTKFPELRTQSSVDTPQKEVFSPAAIAVTVCGILSLMALAMGIYLLVVRRRRRSVLNVNVNAEENDTSVLGVKPASTASQVKQSV